MSLATPASARASVLALTLRADLAAAEVFTCLRERSLEAVLLRGPAIARALYPEGERPYSDCDLLVGGAQWRAVERLLCERGFAPASALSFAQHWRRARDGVEIDLHRRLWGVRCPSERFYGAMARHRAPLLVEGAEVDALDAPALLLVVALHASQHANIVARTLNDLERALARYDEAVWRDAVELAREVEALLALRQGLTMLQAGRARLAALGLAPARSTQSVLRGHGLHVPDYLFEALTARERLSLLRGQLATRRAAPGGAAAGAHALPRRRGTQALRLARAWWQARREAQALGGGRAAR